MILLWIIGSILFTCFFLIVFRGAPFVPTRSADLDELFSLHAFKKGDVLVDLGSGDGRVLVAAANRGIQSIGYELNPFLAWYSRLKLRRFEQKAVVKLEDFWRSKLPTGTAVVFVFLAGPYMRKLDLKLEREVSRLGHDIVLVSYGMHIPNKAVETTRGGYVVYRYKA